MGLLDKAKQQASQIAQKGQEAAKKGQEKLETAQAKKREDALLRDLGAAVYAERTGRGTVETAAETERLLAELRSHEAAKGTIDTAPKADQPESAAQQDNAGGATGGGSFTLDEM